MNYFYCFNGIVSDSFVLITFTMEYKGLQFVQFGNDIFAPISLKNSVIKEILSSFIIQISRLVSFIYGFIHEIIRKENDAISKIFKFVFGFDLRNLININDLFKIIMIALFVCICIYFYETFEKINSRLREMNFAIKQLQAENDYLKNKLDSQNKKNTILADEIDTIHSELVKCIKKVKKIEKEL